MLCRTRFRLGQRVPVAFEIPDSEETSLSKVRDAINVLASTRTNTKGMFGDKEEVDPISHLLGTAYGWGGLPEKAAVYVNVVPEKNDGKTPYVLTISKKWFLSTGSWSITVYNAKGFMEKNDLNAYSVNNVTAKKNSDGTVTIHFGGAPSGHERPAYNTGLELHCADVSAEAGNHRRVVDLSQGTAGRMTGKVCEY